MPAPLTREDLAAVAAPFERARPLPRAAYVDPRVLELELRAVFGRGWCAGASAADVAQPGAWVRVPLPGENLVVARGADLSLAALHDVCRHRGTLLLDGDHGCLPALEVQCPYHGWTYDLGGALRRAPGMPAGFDCRAHGLHRARVASRYGVVFVSRDPDAPALEAALQDGPPWLRELHPAMVRRVRRTEWHVAANWKLVAANFQESHHFPRVHPSLERLTAWRDSASIVSDAAWLGGVMQLAPDAETVSLTARVNNRPFIVPEAARRLVYDALVFPNLLTSLQPDYLLTYRLYPQAVDRTLVVAEVYFHAAARDTDGYDECDRDGRADVFAFWDRTNAEDRAICERQQRGLASARADGFVYAPSEDGVHAFERLVAARLAAALDAQAGAA